MLSLVHVRHTHQYRCASSKSIQVILEAHGNKIVRQGKSNFMSLDSFLPDWKGTSGMPLFSPFVVGPYLAAGIV